MNLALITARGGSKRIPRKNVREFCGEPIIGYSIRSAIESGCFDEVMVSTDDPEIAETGRRYGARVPFFRSPATAGDHATTADVVHEVLQEYARRGTTFVLACCLYPTAPFITPAVLRQGRALLEADPDLAGAIPVTRFSFPIERAVRVRAGRMTFVQPEHMLTRSQDLEPAYHDAGQFYWLRTRDFLATRRMVMDRTAAIVLPEWQVQDIDNEDDWVLAELKYQVAQQRLSASAESGR